MSEPFGVSTTPAIEGRVVDLDTLGGKQALRLAAVATGTRHGGEAPVDGSRIMSASFSRHPPKRWRRLRIEVVPEPL